MTGPKQDGRIALCVPAHNAAKHLPRLLESVRAQTVPFDEVWVYDDASTDDTAQIAETLGARVVRGNINRGCSFGKNALAELAGSKWIHFHDSDDALLPGFVERAKQWVRSDQYDVILFGYEERDDATGQLIGVRSFDAKDVGRDPVSYTIRVQINPFCGLYRRDPFMRAGGYDLDPLVLYNEDVALHCRLARAGLTFTADESVLLTNFRRRDSMSASNQAKCLAAHYHVMRKSADALGGQYAEEISYRLWSVAGGSGAYLDWTTADAAAALALNLGGSRNVPSGMLFKALCSVSPCFAIRLREAAIRLFKPRYRQGYPAWRQGGTTVGEALGPR